MDIAVTYDDTWSGTGNHSVVPVQTLSEATMLVALRESTGSYNARVVIDGIPMPPMESFMIDAEITVENSFHSYSMTSTVNSLDEARVLAKFKKENGATDITILVNGIPAEYIN